MRVIKHFGMTAVWYKWRVEDADGEIIALFVRKDHAEKFLEVLNDTSDNL